MFTLSGAGLSEVGVEVVAAKRNSRRIGQAGRDQEVAQSETRLNQEKARFVSDLMKGTPICSCVVSEVVGCCRCGGSDCQPYRGFVGLRKRDLDETSVCDGCCTTAEE